MPTVTVLLHKCRFCNYRWIGRTINLPRRCPNCHKRNPVKA